MQALLQALRQHPIVYITRDLERAIGLARIYRGYYIITNSTPFAKKYTKGRKNILLVKAKKTLDTRDLLTHAKTKQFLKKLHTPQIVVFKNTVHIEKICSEMGAELLNPPAELANTVEEKISQIHWLGELTKYLPPFHIQLAKELVWSGEKYIVQFNRAHTGSGTMLIESQQQVDELKAQFPNREVRVTQFISGPAFTNNNVVWGTKVLTGNINYQITGLSPFTTRPFATIGNDWALPGKLLSSKQTKQYKKIATDVGKKLAREGWKGLFGIDVIMDDVTGKLYLIEINARQPASTTFESQLQQSVISNPRTNEGEKSSLHRSNTRSLANARDDNYVSTFEAHLAALIGLPATSYQLQAITDGAQAIVKAKGIRSKDQGAMKKIKKLTDLKLNVIPYSNTELESDLLRIQSQKSIVHSHNTLNALGTTITNILKNNTIPYRAGVLFIKHNKLLVIKRKRGTRMYQVLPGGGNEEGETVIETALREGTEETGLHFTIDTTEQPLIYFHNNKPQFYFFAKQFSGKPILGGPEKKQQSNSNTYSFEWIMVPKGSIKKVVDILFKNLEKAFDI